LVGTRVSLREAGKEPLQLFVAQSTTRILDGDHDPYAIVESVGGRLGNSHRMLTDRRLSLEGLNVNGDTARGSIAGELDGVGEEVEENYEKEESASARLEGK
jgi:hypothetical protein